MQLPLQYYVEQPLQFLCIQHQVYQKLLDLNGHYLYSQSQLIYRQLDDYVESLTQIMIAH